MATLLIKNIGCLQTPVGSFAHGGASQGENLKLYDASVYIEDGMIRKISADGVLAHSEDDVDTVVDAEGKLVTPGLVEGHTHLVFGGYRQNEIPLKLKGAGYLDILRAGGGILDTVRKTREATFHELYDKTEGFLDEIRKDHRPVCGLPDRIPVIPCLFPQIQRFVRQTHRILFCPGRKQLPGGYRHQKMSVNHKFRTRLAFRDPVQFLCRKQRRNRYASDSGFFPEPDILTAGHQGFRAVYQTASHRFITQRKHRRIRKPDALRLHGCQFIQDFLQLGKFRFPVQPV